MYKLCYFVPASHIEQTKQALFDVGAGKIGDYDSCAWQCEGEGQFRPLAGSDPFLGSQGELERRTCLRGVSPGNVLIRLFSPLGGEYR